MPVYEFRCPHGDTLDTDRTPPFCDECMSPMRRIWSFSFKRPMADHYNPSVGSYVRSEQDFTDKLKAMSDEATERTGIPHNYVPVDPTDRKALGVTDEGLDATYDAEVRAGKRDVKVWH